MNWARTETVVPARVASPRSTEDVVTTVREAVRDGLTVKAVGSGHSFTGVAVAPGVQVRPDGLADLISLDRDTGLVTVGAGIPLHRLNPLLAEHGLALELLGDIDRQTIGGAISTGTHGSGRRFGSLPTQVRGLEMVLADGSVVRCSDTENPELFSAARLSLGALGVITRFTLQCVPLYALHAVDRPRPLDEVLDGMDALIDDNDHFEFFWFPHTATALTRRFQRRPGDVALHPRSRIARTIDDRLVTNVGYEALLRLGTRAPRLIPRITKIVSGAISGGEYTDLAPNVFASLRDVRFREGEYAVPRESVVDVLRELRSWVATHDEGVSFPFEVRFGRADDVWLSPAYERDVAYVAFHQYHRLPHERWFGVCEDVLGAVGGRPHWGKMHRLGAGEMRGRYPRFDDFGAVRAKVDPTGVYANPYLDRVLGPIAGAA